MTSDEIQRFAGRAREVMSKSIFTRYRFAA
jgi:hypothetical protein